METDNLDFHALLPPVLYEPLLDLEDYKASNVLHILVNRIRELRALNAP